MMKKKKLISGLLCLAMTATLLGGCAGQKTTEETADGKEKVTIALWGNQLLEHYTEYLCDSFPDVEFEFTLATNSTDFYRFLNDHDDLPDILTVRSTGCRPVRKWTV